MVRETSVTPGDKNDTIARCNRGEPKRSTSETTLDIQFLSYCH